MWRKQRRKYQEDLRLVEVKKNKEEGEEEDPINPKNILMT